MVNQRDPVGVRRERRRVYIKLFDTGEVPIAASIADAWELTRGSTINMRYITIEKGHLIPTPRTLRFLKASDTDIQADQWQNVKSLPQSASLRRLSSGMKATV